MNAEMSWVWPTLILAGAAFAAPYYVTRALGKYYAPELDIEFKDKDPYCRHAKTVRDARPYYCHFVVVNSGRSQADDCEAVLERIWDWCGEKKDLEWQERKKFIPVNLKWSGENPRNNFERACFKTVYPGRRKYFCDIGSVREWEKVEKFVFELPRSFISQEDYLLPGKYKIQISVYSKNAAKVIIKFVVDWRGGWRETQEKMQKRLKMKMLSGEKN